MCGIKTIVCFPLEIVMTDLAIQQWEVYEEPFGIGYSFCPRIAATLLEWMNKTTLKISL
jgi:hypothetical protein